MILLRSLELVHVRVGGFALDLDLRRVQLSLERVQRIAVESLSQRKRRLALLQVRLAVDVGRLMLNEMRRRHLNGARAIRFARAQHDHVARDFFPFLHVE